MGVDVAEDDRVGGVEFVKSGIDVEGVARRAGGDRRLVDIHDVEEGVVKFDVDC